LTRQEHLTFFLRLHILGSLVDGYHTIDLTGLYVDLIKLYALLLENDFDFDIETVTYEELIMFENNLSKKVVKPLHKRSVVGLLIWLKKIYAFNHTVESVYKGKAVIFSNADNSLIVNHNNISATFVIDGNLLRYISYSVDEEDYEVKETILFKLSTFDRFLANIDEYYACQKSILEMALY
jgi:hypothetical protein